MRTPRLPVVDWTDAPADLNGLIRFAEKRNWLLRVCHHISTGLYISWREESQLLRSARAAVGILQKIIWPETNGITRNSEGYVFEHVYE